MHFTCLMLRPRPTCGSTLSLLVLTSLICPRVAASASTCPSSWICLTLPARSSRWPCRRVARGSRSPGRPPSSQAWLPVRGTPRKGSAHAELRTSFFGCCTFEPLCVPPRRPLRIVVGLSGAAIHWSQWRARLTLGYGAPLLSCSGKSLKGRFYGVPLWADCTFICVLWCFSEGPTGLGGLTASTI